MNLKQKRTGPILQAAACILPALYLCLSAIDIYTRGAGLRALDPSSSIYSPEIVREKLMQALPLLIVCLCLLIAGTILASRSKKAVQPEPVYRYRCDPKQKNPRRTRRIRQLLFALSLILILSGILNGSARDVLIKAITICSECIGLG